MILGRDRARLMPTVVRHCSSIIRLHPAAWPGGSATSSFGEGSFDDRRGSRRWPRALAAGTTWTSAGASRFALRSRLVLRRRGAGHRRRRARLITSLVRSGLSNCSTRRPASRYWPTGAAGWGRTCSTRPTSAAGFGRPGLDHDPLGARPGELRRGPGRRRVRSACPARRSTSDRAWPPAMARGAIPPFFAPAALGLADDPISPDGPPRRDWSGPAGLDSTTGLARGATHLTRNSGR